MSHLQPHRWGEVWRSPGPVWLPGLSATSHCTCFSATNNGFTLGRVFLTPKVRPPNFHRRQDASQRRGSRHCSSPHPPPSAPPARTPLSNLPEPSISPHWNTLSPRSRYVSSPPSRDCGPFHGEVPLGQMVLVAGWYPTSPPTSEFRDSPLIDQVCLFLWNGWRSPQTAPTQGFHRDTAFTVMREFHRVSEASYHALRQDLSIMEAKLFDFPKRFR